MSKGPKISIITACYNAEKTIEQTIQSVINQTYDNIEYIIIDGASTDGTMDIVERYHEKINVIVSEADQGVYDAFNKGVSLATGDYINFMNSDDYFKDNFILSKVAEVVKEKKPKILYGKVIELDEVTGEWSYRGHSMTLNHFSKGDMCPHQGMFTERIIFNEFGGFDVKYKIFADVDFTIKCFKKYQPNTLFLDEVIAVFRMGGLSTNLKYRNKFHEENKGVHLSHFNNYPAYSKQYFENKNHYIINEYYNKWLTLCILDNKSILDIIGDQNESVAIFGTKKLGVLLYYYLRKNGFKVSGFIDNNINMQGNYLLDQEIVSFVNIDLLQTNTIIVAIERLDGANEVKQMIHKQYQELKVITWYELIDSSNNDKVLSK